MAKAPKLPTKTQARANRIRALLSGPIVSEVMQSNLYTMACTSKIDVRQNVPEKPSMPAAPVRILRGQLILEEVFETLCKGLGIVIQGSSNCDPPIEPGSEVTFKDLVITASDDPNRASCLNTDMEEAVDGIIDAIYVLVGTLAAMGVTDMPHTREVCLANNAKFPDGEATVDKNGKFQKPKGWVAPNHKDILERQPSLRVVQDLVIEEMTPGVSDVPEIGSVAYHAYCHQAGGRSTLGKPGQGRPLPVWVDMDARTKAAWNAAYGAVAHHLLTGIAPRDHIAHVAAPAAKQPKE